MGRYRKPVQYIILAVVLLIGGYAIGNSLFSKSVVLTKGDKPPGFRLADLNNVVHDMEDYEGKPLIINFWGTFCPPCRNEMPALQHQYDKWKGQGLELIGINLSEDKLTAESFIRQIGVDFPILLDKDKKTERKYGLKQYPTTFFIAPTGEIQEVVIGGVLTEEEIDKRIERLIQTKS
ncbi:thiol-disulfide oxidoreductase [Cohnella sp. CIP 111063]|jgi:Peroxiredoxin|uniref:redoxin domain-containing protein n=1 Tax=unclassified Cohnella TaxID=2636738 RepID=UPI000B8BD70A|nr:MULTISPECIES: redoxin domain-containing protein [unclassified Cohnella]OXS61249.1 thiol-disulfide oxidoreductase [Cohnella sp. CIP 111063]PRX73822.1 peroxiredoxin [Cohnella sp. SGD-V74]